VITSTDSEKLNFSFVTHAPDGTLGDPSSCLKQIKLILNNPEIRDKIGQINFMVSVDSQDLEKVKELFAAQNLPDSVKFMPIIKKKDEISNYKDLLSNQSAIFLVATYHFLEWEEKEMFLRMPPPVIVTSEYNVQYRSKAAKDVPIFPEINTGLGKDGEGIYIENLDPYREIILRKEQINNVYFAYHQKHDNESKKNFIDPAKYIAMCIQDALDDNRDEIEIIIPISPTSGTNKSKEDIEAYLKNNMDSNIELEFYQQIDGVLKAVDPKPNQDDKQKKIKVRVMDLYPLNSETMRRFIVNSNPLSLCTGDQSFSEFLSAGTKVPFYQIKSHKEKFFEALLYEIETTSELGKDCALYQFYALQFQDTNTIDTPHTEAYLFYKSNKIVLLKQIALFRDSLDAKRNLYENFGKLATELILNDREYIKKILARENMNLELMRNLFVHKCHSKESINAFLENILSEDSIFKDAVNNFTKEQPENILGDNDDLICFLTILDRIITNPGILKEADKINSEISKKLPGLLRPIINLYLAGEMHTFLLEMINNEKIYNTFSKELTHEEKVTFFLDAANISYENYQSDLHIKRTLSLIKELTPQDYHNILLELQAKELRNPSLVHEKYHLKLKEGVNNLLTTKLDEDKENRNQVLLFNSKATFSSAHKKLLTTADKSLLAAAATGNIPALKKAIHNKANINAVDADGYNSLQLAIKSGKSDEIIKILVKSGIDLTYNGNMQKKNGL